MLSGKKLCAPSTIHRYMDESDRTSGFDGTSSSLSLRRRTRFTEVGDFIKSISQKISTENTVSGRLCKNRKWWSGTVSGENLRAPSSIHWYMDESDRTSGLGGTSTSLSFCCFCPHFCCSHQSCSHSFRDIEVKVYGHIALLVTISLLKKLGGRTPRWEIFPLSFSIF